MRTRWRLGSGIWTRGWRKRVGIEPTAPGINPEPDGFEGRAGHQTRIASVAQMTTGRTEAQTLPVHRGARSAPGPHTVRFR